MARNRIIKATFWDDQKLATVSIEARFVFIGTWTFADDYGVVKGHAAWLKNRLFPYDGLELPKFENWLKELEDLRVILAFEADEERFYWIRNFQKHQVINRPSQARNPNPPQQLIEDSMNSHGALIDERERERERKVYKGAPTALDQAISWQGFKEKFQPTNSEDMMQVIEYFLKSFKECRGQDHKPLKAGYWLYLLDSCLYVSDGEHVDEDISVNQAERMIDNYFQTAFQPGCDYSLVHYNSVKPHRWHEAVMRSAEE